MREQMGYALAPKTESDQKRDAMIKKRSRVYDPNNVNKPYVTDAYDLATVEDGFREELATLGNDKKVINRIADKISDETLEKMEANNIRGIDALTGLRSRSAYKEELPQLLNIEKRINKDCAILMIDCDHFKSVNDSYGHLAGDDVLKKIAKRIKESVRASDIVYRYGGEEFVVFLPDTFSWAARKIAEKIRANVAVQGLEIIKENGEKIILHKTVSIGVVGTDDLEDWNRYDESKGVEFLEKMIDFADMAAYVFKKDGRNKVTPHNGEIEKI